MNFYRNPGNALTKCLAATWWVFIATSFAAAGYMIGLALVSLSEVEAWVDVGLVVFGTLGLVIFWLARFEAIYEDDTQRAQRGGS